MANVTFILKLRDQITRTAQRAQQSLNGITRSAEQASNALNGFQILAGGAVVASLFQAGAQLEKTTLFFNILTGSVEKGTKLFDQLTQFANTTPFSNSAINKNAQTLLAFGQDASTVIDTLRMLGDVSGGDQQRLGQLTLAFSQMQSAGRLMGQDLLQFINAGFNPLNEISKMTGKSMSELKDAMSKGAISADLVKKAFQNATGPGGKFYKLTEKMGTTMAGKWSTAMGKAKFLVSELGLSMKNLFTPVLDQLIKFIDYLSRARKVIFPLLKGITVFISVVLALVVALKAWVAVQKVLNFLMTANPIGIIIVAIGALVAIIITAYNESEQFREVVDGLGRALRAVWSILWSKLRPALIVVGNLISTLWNHIKNFFNSLTTGTKNISFFANAIKDNLVSALESVITPITAVMNLLSDLWDIVKKIGSLIGSLFSGSFEEVKQAFFDLGDTLKEFVEKRVKLLLKSFDYFSDAFDALMNGEWSKAGSLALSGAKQLVFAPFGTDTEKTKKQAEHIVNAAIDAYNNAAKTAKIKTPSVLAGQSNAQTIDVSSDVKKLQASGIVSGGIKTFNINIASLTGIDTLQTANVKDGGEYMGRSIRDELLKVLADLKQIQ